MQHPASARREPRKPVRTAAYPAPAVPVWPPTGLDLMYAYFFPDED